MNRSQKSPEILKISVAIIQLFEEKSIRILSGIVFESKGNIGNYEGGKFYNLIAKLSPSSTLIEAVAKNQTVGDY